MKTKEQTTEKHINEAELDPHEIEFKNLLSDLFTIIEYEDNYDDIHAGFNCVSSANEVVRVLYPLYPKEDDFYIRIEVLTTSWYDIEGARRRTIFQGQAPKIDGKIDFFLIKILLENRKSIG